jgi:hypothetical protein
LYMKSYEHLRTNVKNNLRVSCLYLSKLGTLWIQAVEIHETRIVLSVWFSWTPDRFQSNDAKLRNNPERLYIMLWHHIAWWKCVVGVKCRYILTSVRVQGHQIKEAAML